MNRSINDVKKMQLIKSELIAFEYLNNKKEFFLIKILTKYDVLKLRFLMEFILLKSSFFIID